MPELNTQEVILDEIRKTNESLKEYVDQQIEAVRKNGFSPADLDEKIDRVNAQMTELRAGYDEAIKLANRPAANDSDYGAGSDKDAELRSSAFIKYLRYGVGESGRAMMSQDEQRALSSASDADGGFLVPTGLESEIITNAYEEAALRGLCQVGSTGRDTVMLGALSKATVAWGTANLAVSPQDLNAGGERIQIHDLRALVLIHNNTLDDTDANLSGELSMMFGDAIAEAEDNAFATGSGAGKPKGVIADSRVQANSVVSGVAAALNDGSNNGVDALIGCMYNLKKTYRRNGTWAMNSQTEAVVRKLKDSNGQYLWQPPVQAGAPATLLGRPLANPEGMPDIAANAFPIVFGDFRRGYKIRDRQGITVSRLAERYAEYDQTGFIVKRRTGGQVTLAEAFSCLKIAAS